MSKIFGYVLISVLLGLGFTGIALIVAHPFQVGYPGIGASGIHGTENGDLHVPGNIIFNAGTNNEFILTHNSTASKAALIPDDEGVIAYTKNIPTTKEGIEEIASGVDQTITFSQSFQSTPVCIASPTDESILDLRSFSVNNVTADDFEIFQQNPRKQTVTVSWICILSP